MDPYFIPFPLIRLPAVPRRWIFGMLDSGDLFDISLCSKRMTQMIKETRTIAKLHKIEMCTEDSLIQVEFIKDKRILIWDFVNERRIEDLGEKRQVGSVCFQYCQKVRNCAVGLDTFNVYYPDVQKGICEVSKHLHHIFPGPVEMKISVAFSSNFSAIFAYEHLQMLESFKIIGSIMLKTLLAQVFDRIKVQKRLKVEPETDDEYPIMQALDVEDLDLENAKWMSTDHLIHLNTRFCRFRGHFFGWKDLEKFALAWKNNPNSKIERVRFYWSEEDMPGTRLNLLKGHKWNPYQREKKYLFQKNNELIRIDCERGLDIERVDGVLATIVQTEEDVYFLVWNERFPEKRRLEKLPKLLEPYYKELESINAQYPDACSLERLLSNRSLSLKEFVDTYRILRSLDGEVRLSSPGRSTRRSRFDIMYRRIDWQDDI